MKHILLSLLLIGIAHTLPAQNWAPVNTTDIYNYKADTASAISHSLWVDSVGFDGVDSVYYPNRIVKNYPNGPGDSYGIALKNQPQFLNKQVTLQANGLYLYTDPTVISYYSLAALNDTYTYDSTNNITATVVAVDEDTILGYLDSIKTILLSSGDTIIASKNHGLLQYPLEYGSGKYYRLAGIEGGRNLGEHVAKFDDFFNYSVGDTFWYYIYESGADGWSYENKNVIAINAIIVRGDTIFYNYNGNYNVDIPANDINIYPNTLYNYPVFSSEPTPFRFTYNAPVNFNYTWIDNSNNFPYCGHFSGDSLKRQISYSSFMHNGKLVKRFDKLYCRDNSMGDTLAYSKNLNRTFIERLGLVYAQTSGFESSGLLVMYAYRLAGDSAITVANAFYNNLVIGIEDEPTTAANFKLLGNPVTHTLDLQLETAEPHTITLYNLSGQKLLQQKVLETNVTIDVAHLPQGVYLLEVSTPTGIGRQRVVKW